jgi:hypothetical protein
MCSIFIFYCSCQDLPLRTSGLTHGDMAFLFYLSSLLGSLLLTIARPTSARLREPTSLVPSPHIKVLFPREFSKPTIIPFCDGEVREKTWIYSIIFAHWTWSLIRITLSKISPLMHSKLFCAKVVISYSFDVSHTFMSFKSFHTRVPGVGLATANKDLPAPKRSS